MNSLNYHQRIAHTTNPVAQKLFALMHRKQTNLCISLDFTTKNELLDYADNLGSEMCVLKTHIDILQDFDFDVVTQLTRLAEKHQFLIFEDRKFADIGNTVQLQYSKGIYRIADWAHITNTHIISGSGTIEGLKLPGKIKGNGLLLLAQMSAKGNLMTQNYTQEAVAMAVAHSDFVIGFIAMQRLTDHPGFLHFTPGVHINLKDDCLGQQYVTPETAIIKNDIDVIIVGRGIYAADDPLKTARHYRETAWQAYQRKLETF